MKSLFVNVRNQYFFSISILVLAVSILCIRYGNITGDFGDFINAGTYISRGENPYVPLMYTNSPVSAYIFFKLSKILPFIFTTYIIQILNIIGIICFIKWVIKCQINPTIIMVFNLILFLNVSRALLGNVQVTGMALGLITLAFKLQGFHGKIQLLSIIPLWFAFEIKPQFTLPYIILFIFSSTRILGYILHFSLLFLLSHIVLERIYGGGINYLWVQKILKYSDFSTNYDSYEISFWKLIVNLIGEKRYIQVISFALIIMVLFLIAKFAKSKPDTVLFLALAFPVINSYAHLYDYYGFVLMTLLSISAKNNFSLFFLYPFLFIFPLSWNYFSLSVFAYLILFIFSWIQNRNKILLFVHFLIFSITIMFFPFIVKYNQEFQMSFYISLYLLVVSIFYIFNVLQKNQLLKN